jgi:hypothetical protein
MWQFQFGDDEDIYVRTLSAVFEMQRDRFSNVAKQLVYSLPLRENIVADAPSTPHVTILIDFDFDEHPKLPFALCYSSRPECNRPSGTQLSGIQPSTSPCRRFSAANQYDFILADSREFASLP